MTFTIILRSIIIYVLVLFLLRIMGKRQIGQLQPYEFVVTLIIADLATVPMSDTALPLLHGIIPLLTLVCLHFVFTFLEKKSICVRKVFNGKPVVLIDPNGINYKNLKMCNMNFNDLQESLRSAGYFNIEEILYAIIQTNGTVTVLPKAKYAPLTADAIDITIPQASLPIIIVAEGKLMKENIMLAKINEEFIIKNTSKIGIRKISDILIMTINTQGKIFIQEYNGSGQVLNADNFNGEW
ncbi:MAG: DUF421 domain-containing protein [Clostridiales bacterium]|nr:DUF421 domain-containing protein [Clostridiales bacterium]